MLVGVTHPGPVRRDEANPRLGSRVGHQGGSSLAVSRYSKSEDAAWLFAQWATSADTQVFITTLGGGTGPTRTSVYDDPRVKAAKGWIAKNYTLEENYGLGIRQKDPKVAAQQGLFYYYHVFAKCLAAVGKKTVTTPTGERAWANDLFAAFAKRQKPDGMFINENDRWWEKDPVLVTAYSINAMNYAYPFLKD